MWGPSPNGVDPFSVFAGCNPRYQVLGGAGSLVAAPGPGVSVGRFAWADLATGTAANARTNASQRLGFALPIRGTWQRTYFDKGEWFIRAGTGVTLASRGEFWAWFPGGAQLGQPVYTDPTTGVAISGTADGMERTPFNVLRSAAPGGRSIISTWSYFSNA